jgi:26S proteasome regulatory subunit N5
MSSGEVLKAEKDFTKEADAQIPQAEKLGAVSYERGEAGTKLTPCSRATHKLPSTSCFRSRRRHARYGQSHTAPTRPQAHTYQASDLASTSRVIIAIVTIAKKANDWNLMNEQVLLLSKKHGQLKQATTKMVQTVMTFLDDTPNLDTKLSVIETLRTVTEGKVSSTQATQVVRPLTRKADFCRSRARPRY